MPNCSKGTLKVRGTYDNLLRFCKNATVFVDERGKETKETLYMEVDNDGFYIENPDNSNGLLLWLKNTERGYIGDSCFTIVKDSGNIDRKFTALFEYFQEWSVKAKNLQKICKQYDVDMKITAFDFWSECQQEIEIICGEIVRDEKFTYDDYKWDCPCPTI